MRKDKVMGGETVFARYREWWERDTGEINAGADIDPSRPTRAPPCRRIRALSRWHLSYNTPTFKNASNRFWKASRNHQVL